MEKMLKRKFDPESALELALQVEKDAVLYYTEAFMANKKRKAKKALERLINEEKGHVTQISKRLAKVRKDKEKGK